LPGSSSGYWASSSHQEAEITRPSGSFIYTAFGGNGSAGIDWVRWLIAIAVAAVLVVIASTVTGRNTTRV
jgi:hypothetical protein